MKKIIYTSIILLALSIANEVFTYTNLPPIALTGAPGEGNCSVCHGPTVTSGQTWNNMTLTTTVPLSAMQPSTTYLMSLTFSDPGKIKYGFQIVALPGNATPNTGSIGTIALNSGNSAVNIATSGNRTYARTTLSGTSASGSTRTWNFNYTTPSVAANGVTFYAVVNSTDNNNSANSNDLIYLKSFSATVLPVAWLDVFAKKINDKIKIYWSTASEINNSHFEIEKSIDNENWQSIGLVNGSGNSNTINHYTFHYDISNTDVQYFRIKQVDFDGNFSYSKTVLIAKAFQNEIIYNSHQKELFVDKDYINNIKILKMNGDVIVNQNINTNLISLNMLPSGIYIILSTDKFGSTHSKKIIVQ